MTKKEQKLNRLWNYLIKTLDKDKLSALSTRAFLYSVGRLSYERVLVELVSVFYGKDLKDAELQAVIEILEGKC